MGETHFKFWDKEIVGVGVCIVKDKKQQNIVQAIIGNPGCATGYMPTCTWTMPCMPGAPCPMKDVNLDPLKGCAGGSSGSGGGNAW